MDPTLEKEIWQRLLTGKPLDDLGLPVVSGRTDMTGLIAPAPSVVRELATPTASVTQLANVIEVRGVHWKGIHFARSRLDSLRFLDATIENCCFDGARCQDWRMWGTAISDTSFQSTDLRKSALGPVADGKRNSFHRVDFSKADLRQTVYVSADMIECKFASTKLSKVDFHGTVFVDCTFTGQLEDVIFHRHAFRGEAYPPNEMRGVDLRGAKLHFVEFRQLEMNDVKWPEDDEHIVLHDYAAVLDRVLRLVHGKSDLSSKGLAGLIAHYRKWATPN